MTDREQGRIVGLEVNPVRMSGGPYYEDAGLTSRVLLVKSGSLNILFDAGPGRKKTSSHHVLTAELDRHGLIPEEITHVVLSNLHQGHSGGLLNGRCDEEQDLLFPNARFITGKDQFDRANHPHSLDQDFFVPGLAKTLEQTKRLTLISEEGHMHLDGLILEFIISQGHTPGMLNTIVRMGKTVIFAGSDLIPGHAWINPAVRMGYSRFAEKLTDEKTQVLDRVVEENAWLFYSHGESAASRIDFDGLMYRSVETVDVINWQI